MEIDVKNIKAAYRTATESERTLLYTLFPDLHLDEEEKGNRPVTERIKTFEDACRELGEDNALVLHYRKLIKENEEKDISMTDIVAFLKLRIICAALNEGWEPQFTENEWRWYPWFFLLTSEELDEKSEEWKQDKHLISTGDFHTGHAGFAYAYSDYAPSITYAYFGSRLCLKNEALADYCGKQFIELWADFNLIRR